VIGIRRRGFGGGHDALDQHDGPSIAQCAVGIDHHGPGSRAIPESNPRASGVLVDAWFGDAGDVALAHIGLQRSSRQAELGREQFGIDGDLDVWDSDR